MLCAIYLLVGANLNSIFHFGVQAHGLLSIWELQVLKTLLDLFIYVYEGIGMVLKHYAIVKAQYLSSLLYSLEMWDNVGYQPLNS